jgi:hypothetical protein
MEVPPELLSISDEVIEEWANMCSAARDVRFEPLADISASADYGRVAPLALFLTLG